MTRQHRTFTLECKLLLFGNKVVMFIKKMRCLK
uniref:Genes for 51.4 kD and 41.9 kD toxin proteins n=1 Tax=Lysinibacillus sphaericus TaxID=1421 RepID=Q45685_LYSSH|nr:unnamed protein product [Lysinibacillus sphaericus]